MQFVNNATSIKILPYYLWPLQLDPPVVPDFAVGRFTDCSFTVNDNYSVGQPFLEHIFLERVRGDISLGGVLSLRFDECVFDMEQKFPNLNNRGILSLGSKFEVVRSEFRNLVKGIEAIPNNAVNSNYKVIRTEFRDCAIGIHNVNNTGAKIVANTFWLGNTHVKYDQIFETPVVSNVTQQVGVYFEGGTNGFELKNNRFWGGKWAT